MTTTQLAPTPIFKGWDSNGNPLAFGKLYSYIAGTTTPTPTYTDSTGLTPNTNPVILNARGEAPVWLNPAQGYKLNLTDSAGNQIPGWPVDNIIGPLNINQSLIPAADNTYDLGSTSSAWRQLYLGANHTPVLDTTSGIIGYYPRTAAEIAAGVTPTNYVYAPGIPERYGAVGDGATDDTAAITACISSNDTVIFTEGKIYAVTSITFPLNGPHVVNFNGAWVRGIAAVATNCVVSIQTEGTTFYSYAVDGNFSQNYLCGTWWYNSSSSSQYNTFFGMRHRYFGGAQTGSGTTIRALVYGALPGNTSVTNAQSENQIYGWRTRGCQNPFYSNHSNGVLQFSDSIFVSLNEDWTGHSGFNFANALCFEAIAGLINVKGGEFQIASAGGTYAANVVSECFFDDIIIETAYPIKIGAPRVRFSGTRYLQDADQPCFTIAAGTSGVLYLNDMHFIRPAGTGGFSNQPLIDASAASTIVFASAPGSGATSATLSGNWSQPSGTYNITFSDAEVRSCTLTNGATTCTWTGGLNNSVSTTAYSPYIIELSDTSSFEYRWTCVGADVRLVKGTPTVAGAVTVRYRNHRMSMTASDPNIWVLNTHPTDSMLDIVSFDRIGYATTGWTLTSDAGGSNTLTATTNSGPPGYPAIEISLNASGAGAQAIGTYGNPSSLANLQTTALKVVPGELYWVGAWCDISTGSNGKLSARFFNASGTSLGDTVVADNGSIPAGYWKYIEGPLVVPASAAFMCLGAFANTSVIEIADLRLKRAS